MVAGRSDSAPPRRVSRVLGGALAERRAGGRRETRTATAPPRRKKNYTIVLLKTASVRVSSIEIIQKCTKTI
jgi:hypothetical protein